MTDYRDAHNELSPGQRRRDYVDQTEGSGNSMFWLIGIAAVIIVGGFFLLSLGPSNDSVPVDTSTAPMTAPAENPANPAATPADPAEAPAPAAPAPAAPAAPAAPTAQ